MDFLDSLKSGILTMLLGIFNIVLKSVCLLMEDFNIVDSLNYTVFFFTLSLHYTWIWDIHK